MHNNKPYDASLKHFDSNAKTECYRMITMMQGFVSARENSGEGTDYKEGFWDLEASFENGKKIRFELEVKDRKFWNPPPFKYDCMHIPERKRKNDGYIFIIFSSCYTRAWMGPNDVFRNLEYKVTWKPCRNYSQKEPFIEIPVEKGKFLKKFNGKWGYDARYN